MIHERIPLTYAYDALEPYIDATTMKIHHTRHHQAYIDKLNAALNGYPELQKLSPETLLRNLEEVPEVIRTSVRNHGGGHVNHTFFWPQLKTDMDFSWEVADAITDTFGNYDAFKNEFKNAASLLFGSGWAWLVSSKGKLEIMTTNNQDNPITCAKTPILGLDVWEHAYYLKYQNRRPEYIDAFFHVIDWKVVNERFLEAIKS